MPAAIPYGPSVRHFKICEDGGSLNDLGALGVLVSVKPHATEQAMEDLTGPTDTSPQNEPTGFKTYSEIELVVKHTLAGSDWVLMDELPPTSVGSSAKYDIDFKLATGENYTGEAWMTGWEPVTDPKKPGQVKLMFKISGDPTYV